MRYLIVLLGILLVGCASVDDNTPQGATSYVYNSKAESGSGEFNALEKLQTNSDNGVGVVLIHGRGGNPDAAVVRQLRHDLYDRGYSTVSIQAPVPSSFVEGDSANQPPFDEYENDVNGNNLVFPETYARIRTAINRLAQHNVNKIVLIGFSMGSRMVVAHVALGQVDELEIIGLIGVGMRGDGAGVLGSTSVMDEVGALAIPVLDLYGDKDFNAVNTYNDRYQAYIAGGGDSNDYTQSILNCPELSANYTQNDCHKLRGGLKGTASAPLETDVSNWISGLL
ncbi:MAG: alpha/beta hydrolase family protein [Gammaproteobacteria bacterium]|nr:alpha/beta hydrolase family protein [Gammaproteobacteria bacterium]